MGFLDTLGSILDAIETIDKNINQSDDTFQHNLYMTCKSLSRNVSSSRFEVSNKILNNFNIRNSGSVYLAYDDSIWEDGAEGFVVTIDGIYGKKPFSDKVVFTSFERLSYCKGVYLRDDGCIYADNYLLGSVSYLNDSAQSKVGSFFATLKTYAENEQRRLRNREE